MARKLALPLSVFIAILAVAALSCSSAAGLPNPFASTTPTVTPTFTPTVTPSPAPTPTSTPTATPVPTGVVINEMAGGGAQIVDYDGGYTIDVPADWVVSKLDPEDIKQALSKAGEDNPGFDNVIKAAQAAEPGTFRVIAIDKDRTHSANGYITNFSVAMFSDTVAKAAPLDIVIQASLESLKSQVPGIKAKQLDSKTNGHGVTIALVELQVPMALPAGQVVLYQKQVYFQTGSALAMVAFSAPLSKVEAVTPSFDAVVDGIQLMKP